MLVILFGMFRDSVWQSESKYATFDVRPFNYVEHPSLFKGLGDTQLSSRISTNAMYFPRFKYKAHNWTFQVINRFTKALRLRKLSTLKRYDCVASRRWEWTGVTGPLLKLKNGQNIIVPRSRTRFVIDKAFLARPSVL